MSSSGFIYDKETREFRTTSIVQRPPSKPSPVLESLDSSKPDAESQKPRSPERVKTVTYKKKRVTKDGESAAEWRPVLWAIIVGMIIVWLIISSVMLVRYRGMEHSAPVPVKHAVDFTPIPGTR